jgi:glycosyltransferase involved in cell wall biosynthesis
MTPTPAATPGFVVSLASPSQAPCGVEMFARGLARAVGELGLDSRLVAVAGHWTDAPALWRATGGAAALVVSLPIVAWKKALLTPLLALLIARLRGARTVVILHEWADLHPLRRAFISAYLLFAQIVLFSSPTVRDQFLLSPVGRLPFKLGLAPIPPNIPPPTARVHTPAVDRVETERANGRLILGHFGSIYPKKQSALVLDVAHALQGRGREVFVVFIGSFVKASDDIEERFFSHARTLGLEASIMVSGYVESDQEIFSLFDAVDLFVYSFAEGLTSRRGSVLTCLESGRPVVVNSPESASEFEHHPVFGDLIAQRALHLLPTNATPAEYARAIDAIGTDRRGVAPEIFDAAWRDAAIALREALT